MMAQSKGTAGAPAGAAPPDQANTNEQGPEAPEDQGNGDVWEETEQLPSGRKSRQVPAVLWAKLEESAKRRVGFARTGTKASIDELRKDLTSAAVRAKYDVSTTTAKLADGSHKLTFAATTKVEGQ